MDWISKGLKEVFNISPFKASQDSLKRKRSPTPRTNTWDSSNSRGEETVEDSEEEREDRRARVAIESRRVRQRTEGYQPSSVQNGRVPLSFKTISQHLGAKKGAVITATDEDELDTLANGFCREVRDDENLVAAQQEWFAERQELRDTIECLQREVGDQADKIHRMKIEIDDSNQRYTELEQKGKHIRHRARDAEQRLENLQVTAQELERRCSDAESCLEKNKGLLQARTEELTVAQAFMTTADQYSVADLSRAVEELNDDIYQIAVSLSDTLLDQKQGAALDNTVAVENARAIVVKRYSEETISRLISDLAQDDTILFECLIQNVLVSRCTALIQSICPADPATDKSLRAVWGTLRVTCEPSIAKNWLALTSSQFKSVEVESASTANLIACLMVVAGWRTEASSSPALPEGVLEKLSEIQSKALKVREMAAEGILSAMIEAFRVPSQRVFNATQMKDAYDFGNPTSTGSAGKDNVVCQTGIGLLCATRVAPPSGSSQAQRKIDIVLKAKVLLSSTLLSPPQ